MKKIELVQFIEENKDIFEELSDKVWECAELSLQEHKSMEHYIELM